MPTANPTNRKRFASVPLTVLLYMSWRNINAKSLRSAITIVGVTIGIGAICFLVSMVLGLQTLVTQQIIGNKSVKVIDLSSQNSRIVKLDKTTIDKVRELPKVESLGVSYSQAGTINLDKSKLDTVVYGIDLPYQSMVSPTVINGRLLTKGETDSGYVSKALLEAINIRDPKQAVGKPVTVTITTQITDDKGNVSSKKVDKEFNVVGVIDAGTGGGAEIYLPAAFFADSGLSQYSQVKLIAQNIDAIAGLRKQIESFGLQTASPIDTIEQVNQIFSYFALILLGFGAIGMVIAILGMFNTLTISLLERTGEIGLLKALGGRRRDMRRLFYFEALLLSLIGALAGILFAVGSGIVVNYFMNQLAISRGITEPISLFVTPWWLILALVASMMFIGFLVVIVPARRAERINPVEAMRQG